MQPMSHRPIRQFMALRKPRRNETLCWKQHLKNPLLPRIYLYTETVDNALKLHPELKGAVIHSDRGSQYTSDEYRRKIAKYDLKQSMNSAGGRCHDNARCESMWARMKVEVFYSRNDKPENYTVEELKTKIWRYYMSYWNNRRICSANGGLPPAVKRQKFYAELSAAA